MSRHFAPRSFRATAIALTLPLLLAACGGGGSDNPAPANPAPPTAPAVTLNAVASAVQLLAGAATTLSATVSDNSAVTWQLAAGAPGKLSATTGASVTYTAPTTGIAVPTAVNVTATAAGLSKTVQIVVNPEPGSPGLSLIAGSPGSNTIVDGDAVTARFANITDVQPAADGSLLVIDYPGTIRKVSGNGAVTTLASGGTQPDSSPGAFRGVAAAADGGAWAVQAQSSSAVLRRVRADGSAVTVGAPMPELAGTVALVAGGADELYALVSSPDAEAIYRLSTGGTVTLLAGGPASGTRVDGQGAAARFVNPKAMTRAASGDLWVIDGAAVRRISTTGQVTTMSLADSATGTSLPPSELLGIAARTDGTLSVLAQTSQRYMVYSVAPDGKFSILTDGALAPEPSYYSPQHPTNFKTVRTTSDGTLLLANRGEIRRWQGGAFTHFAGLEDDSVADIDGTGAAARFVDPIYVASDQRGTIYVADHPTGYGHIISVVEDFGLYLRRIDAAGNVTTLMADATFDRPTGLLADSAGSLYVLEMPRNRSRIFEYGGGVYKIAPGGQMTLIAGKKGYAGGATAVDGKGAAANFLRPTFAGMAPDGTLYVNDISAIASDARHDIIRKVTPDGTVTTVAALPADVGLAPDGKRYGYDGSTIYRTEADGKRTVIAGQKGLNGTVLGALPGGLSPAESLAPTGLYTFALISNGAVVKLVVPH